MPTDDPENPSEMGPPRMLRLLLKTIRCGELTKRFCMAAVGTPPQNRDPHPDRDVGKVICHNSTTLASRSSSGRRPKTRKAPDKSEAFPSGPRRDRTADPLIKSQLLYQLS